MSRSTVRSLDMLPLSMTVDSDPQMVDGECVIPRPLPKKALAVKAATNCNDCHGRAMVTEIVTAAGEDPVRNERPCSCVWRAVQAFEFSEMGGTPRDKTTAASFQPAEAALDRAQRRVARIQQELAAAEADEAATVLAREAKVAPYLARVTEAESAAEQAIVHDAACRGAVADSSKLADEAAATFKQAQEALSAALVAYEQATNLAEASQKRLAPLALAIDAAKEEARLAQNRGGERHRLQITRKRIADMRVRLKYAEEDAAQLSVPVEGEGEGAQAVAEQAEVQG